MESARLWEQCHSEGPRRCPVDLAGNRLPEKVPWETILTSRANRQLRSPDRERIGDGGGTLHFEGTRQAPGPVGNSKVSGALGGKRVAVLVPEG